MKADDTRASYMQTVTDRDNSVPSSHIELGWPGTSIAKPEFARQPIAAQGACFVRRYPASPLQCGECVEYTGSFLQLDGQLGCRSLCPNRSAAVVPALAWGDPQQWPRWSRPEALCHGHWLGLQQSIAAHHALPTASCVLCRFWPDPLGSGLLAPPQPCTAIAASAACHCRFTAPKFLAFFHQHRPELLESCVRINVESSDGLYCRPHKPWVYNSIDNRCAGERLSRPVEPPIDSWPTCGLWWVVGVQSGRFQSSSGTSHRVGIRGFLPISISFLFVLYHHIIYHPIWVLR